MNDSINLAMGKDGVFHEVTEPFATIMVDTEEDMKALYDAVERGKKMRWISVKDKVPKPHEAVLTFVRQGIEVWMSIACRNDAGFWLLSLTGGRDDWSVTHWMPLPEPPKEGVR